MAVWHPDILLPPLKCILICYQLSCEGSKLFSSHWISLGVWWLLQKSQLKPPSCHSPFRGNWVPIAKIPGWTAW